ncbi:hypothetical protein [Formosa haliotis]|uniref:hypothetical protein n=1 Tax=Formosa haliotis TaxID=1555194 RepID=UPI000826C362|nr:hypothetical protein [Formosa haliotis]
MSDVLVNNLDLFVQQDFFSRQIVDNIPGVFYVYKEYNGVYKLFTCNEQHLRVTGYSAEESFKQEPFFFIDNASVDAIAQGLSKIKTQNYVKQVYGSFLTKKGKLIPYVFEGYGFEYDCEHYFMGVGTNISDLAQAHQDLKNERLQRELKEKELLALTLKDKQKEDVLSSISKKLDQILLNTKSAEVAQNISKLTNEINASLMFSDDNWQEFEMLFNNIHKNFYAQLLIKHPSLTKSEQYYCALIKLHMNSEQVCNTLNITREGLKKKRYRLKRKLDLKNTESIESYISKI